MSARKKPRRPQAESIPAASPSAPSNRTDRDRDLRDRAPAAAIVLVFVLLALFHARITPLARTGSFINAPDEAAHIGYVRALAVGKRLPARNDPDFATYQWHQPPAYYAIVSGVYREGLVPMRGVSMAMAVLSLWSIWSAARLLWPDRPKVHLLALLIPALTPMRQATLASVGNDAGAEMMVSLGLYALLLIVLRGLTYPRLIGISLLMALGLLTKVNTMLLWPVALGAIWYAARDVALARRIGVTLIPVCAALIIAAPWLRHNLVHYGQPLPLRAFQDEFAHTSRAADWIGKRDLRVDLWSGDLRPGMTMTAIDYQTLVVNWTARTFVAAFTPPSLQSIGVPRFLEPPAYIVYYALLVTGLIAGAYQWSRRPAHTQGYRASFALLAALLLLVVLSFVGFTQTYFQAQGRYLYPAILPVSLIWALGIDGITPPRYQTIVLLLLGLVLMSLSVAFLFIYVAPSYR